MWRWGVCMHEGREEGVGRGEESVKAAERERERERDGDVWCAQM